MAKAKNKGLGSVTTQMSSEPALFGQNPNMFNTALVGMGAKPAAESLVSKTIDAADPYNVAETYDYGFQSNADNKSTVANNGNAYGSQAYINSDKGIMDTVLGYAGIKPVSDMQADSRAQYNKYLADNNLTATEDYTDKVTGKTVLGENTYQQFMTDQDRLARERQQSLSNLGGFGLGAVQGITGVMSYLDNRKVNAKNMQLMDQQIANNQDIMATRKARAADIQKYFG